MKSSAHTMSELMTGSMTPTGDDRDQDTRWDETATQEEIGRYLRADGPIPGLAD
jgi:hypothetical protein